MPCRWDESVLLQIIFLTSSFEKLQIESLEIFVKCPHPNNTVSIKGLH